MCKYAASVILLLFSTFSFAEPIDIHLENTPIREVAGWYADQTGQSVSVDPRINDAVLTVYGARVEPDQLPAFFQGLLRANGFELVGDSPAVIVSASRSSSSYSPSDYPGIDLSASSGSFMSEVEVVVVPRSTAILGFDYVRASDLVEVVQHVLSSGDNSAPFSVSVVDSTNSLLITGPDEQVEMLHQYRDDLDQPHPQVFIRALFYEVSEGSTLDFGLSYGRPDPAASGSGSPVAWAFNGAALGRGISGSGAAFGIFDGDMLSVAASAISRDQNANLLSTPQVLTLSGRSGVITVGQNVPVITGKATGEAASVDSPFQTIERKDVGLSLDVRPVVLANGSIVLDVNATSDSISDSAAASDIITNQRRVSTTVQIQSGQTLLLGGLISDDETETVSGVPVLKDIPLMGALFKTTSTRKERRTLHVLLQAHVI